jgi:hypothetical protein
MKKRSLSVCFILFLIHSASAQVEFMHSLGGKYFFYANTDGARSGLVLYSPRVNLLTSDNSALSVGTHFGLGFSIQVNLAGESASSLVLDMPLVAEYNFGFGSTLKSNAKVGGYLGAGYALHRISLNVDGESASLNIHGPVFTGGFRFDIRLVGSFEVGASYMPDSRGEEDKFNIFGVSVSYMLGMGRRNKRM